VAQGLLREDPPHFSFSLGARGPICDARAGKVAATICAVKDLCRVIKAHHMTDDVELRRRRAVYRAHHRGTKEMDWILGRFADATVGAFSTDRLGTFERMLNLPDPDLQDMILHPQLKPAGEFADLVAQVRSFHGLEP
jgi:antitoxin CptB